MPKCSHDKCINEAEPGSQYCKDCIQLPTKECNYCNIGTAEPSEMRKLAESIEQKRGTRITPVHGLMVTTAFVFVGIILGLMAIRFSGLGNDYGWLGIFCGGMGGLFMALVLMTWKKWV